MVSAKHSRLRRAQKTPEPSGQAAPAGKPSHPLQSRVYTCSVTSDSVTPRTVPTRLLCPWDSPCKNTGVGCHALLQGVVPTQGSNPGLLHCKQILYCLSHQGSPVLELFLVFYIGEAPFAIREGACGLRKWCKLLVLKFDWSSA